MTDNKPQKEEEKKEENKNFDIDSIVLKNEKDFIELAKKNTKEIKDSLDPSVFSYVFLKETIEMLAPTLNSEKISDLEKKIDVVLKKKKTKGEDLKNKKPLKSVTSTQRADKVGLEKEYGGGEEKKEEDEEYNEDEDFM